MNQDALNRYQRAIPDPQKLLCSFTLPRCPTNNGLTVTLPSRKRVKSQEYKEWIAKAKTELLIQMHEQKIFVALEKVSVILTVEPKSRHTQDAANYEKAVTDLMVHCDVLKDDSLIHFNGQVLDWDKLGGDKIHYDIYALQEEDFDFFGVSGD